MPRSAIFRFTDASLEYDKPAVDRVLSGKFKRNADACQLIVKRFRIIGDLNGDQGVDQIDLDLLLSNWSEIVATGSRYDGDLDPNGFVDFSDLNLVLNNWTGSQPPIYSVPEPTSAVLLFGLSICLAFRRRSRR